MIDIIDDNRLLSFLIISDRLMSWWILSGSLQFETETIHWSHFRSSSKTSLRWWRFPCHSSMDRSKGNGLGTGGHLNVNFAVNVKEDGQNLGFGPLVDRCHKTCRVGWIIVVIVCNCSICFSSCFNPVIPNLIFTHIFPIPTCESWCTNGSGKVWREKLLMRCSGSSHVPETLHQGQERQTATSLKDGTKKVKVYLVILLSLLEIWMGH